MEVRFDMPNLMLQAIPVLEALVQQGFEAVFVGGCVRDTAMGLPIKDVDIATSARPEQVMSIFPRCIPTGLQHGTVTVLHDGGSYEVTTFRTESEYEKHRRPLQVEFIDRLDGDLLRRDLTINAMAMNAAGELYDPFRGLNDLKNRTIRCVGDADARFQEDALRMLRTIRFASQFEFTIAHTTWRALVRHRELLRHIAMERVHAELDRMIGGAHPGRALHLLAASKLLRYTGTVLPAAEKLAQVDPSYSELDKLNDPDARYAALLLAEGITLSDAEETLKALRLPTQKMNAILSVLFVQFAMNQLNQQSGLRLVWTSTVLQYGEEASRRWLSIVVWNQKHHLHDQKNLFDKWLDAMPAMTLKQLNLNGKQLAEELQRVTGNWTGLMLKRLLLEVALDKLPNEKDLLLKQAQIWNAEDQ
ncbi:CCA tRNA nucleotidyltransferase [Paenibacillus sp. JDR-2]|uniref:CCA tRNA nucleotidyltransferase n=1 Tax=Paenibacillus sp. (strain JDR-2) TaxID=324057 RepID=UPI000166743E|nr:CCA tRNA nucleotidyltransferase [Paenibacillus sp. JDR-2]ACT01098.1 Polynucleotide adenylyltransferase region [Paenibacillus sp. JDR-2]